MATSPSINNYIQGGTGTVTWTPDGGSPRDLGNCLSFELSPEMETREHKNFRGSTVTVDKTSIISKKATLAMQLDEITPENLAMFLFGTIATNSAGNKEFEIFAADEVVGQIVFQGMNGTGNKFKITLPSVSFIPTGSFNTIGEDDLVLELQGNVQDDGTGFGTVETTDETA